jgi:hypothetical protein
MPRKTRIRFFTPWLLGLILIAGSASADEVGSSFIEGLIKAQLVFEGEVVDVRYRLSTPTAVNRAAIPHTFVTYRIDHVYKGSVADNTRSETPATVTLRFIGGEGVNDEYMTVSGQPLFDVGDHDLLMAVGNGENICPLTNCQHGRYRIIDNYVYNEDGQEIVSTADAPVVYGKFHELRDVTTHQMGAAQLQLVSVHENGESGLPAPQPDYGIHYDATSFRAIVEDTLNTLDQAGLLPALAPLPSMDPDVDFVVAGPAAVAPGGEALYKLRRALRDNGRGIDRLEALLVRFNGGDPRLPMWAANLISRVQVQALTAQTRRRR